MKALLCLLVLCIGLGGCSPAGVAEEFSLHDIARDFNKNCPRTIDADTRIDGIDIAGPNTLVYRYTLLRLSLANADTAALRRALRPGIVSMIRLSKEMEGLRQKHAVFHYRYNDRNNQHLCTIKVYPADYQP